MEQEVSIKAFLFWFFVGFLVIWLIINDLALKNWQNDSKISFLQWTSVVFYFSAEYVFKTVFRPNKKLKADWNVGNQVGVKRRSVGHVVGRSSCFKN